MVAVRLRALASDGIGLGRVAHLTGLSVSRVQRLRNGTTPRVRASVAQKILALRPTPAPATLRPPARARQLVRWFVAEGFTFSLLAARVGLDRHTVACHRAVIRLSTELTLAAFRRLLTE